MTDRDRKPPRSRLFRFAAPLLAACALLRSGPAPAQQGADPPPAGFVTHLALSPDGETLLLATRGDIWSVPSRGGAASRLTVHPAVDTAPVWSHDGEKIAFASLREGRADIFVMDRFGRGARRLTHSDENKAPYAFFPGDERILAATTEREVLDRSLGFLSVPLSGATPLPFSALRGHGPDLSPDGRFLAFERGMASIERKGYVGAASQNLWLWEVGSDKATRLTDRPGRDSRPQWAGGSVWFLSDRSGSLNVWAMPPAGDAQARQITFADRDVRAFSVSADGTVLACAAGDGLWRAEAPDFEPEPLEVFLGDDIARSAIWREIKANGATAISPAPDGQEMAVVIRGEIFLVPAEEKRPTIALDRSPARDRQPAWSPDGKTLYFVSDREGIEHIYAAEPVFSMDEAAGAAPASVPEAAPSAEAAAPAPAEEAAPAPSGEEAKALATLAEKRVESLGARLVDLEARRDELLPKLERARLGRENAPEIQALPSYQKLWDAWLNAGLARQSMPATAAPEEIANLEGRIATLESLLARTIDGHIADLQAEADSLETRRAAAKAEFEAAARELARLRTASAAPAPAPKASAASEPKPEKEEEKRTPFWKALAFNIRRVGSGPGPDFEPRPSPDGKRLAFIRGRGDLMVMDLATGEEKFVYPHWNMAEVRWSPDGRWLSFHCGDGEDNGEVWIASADGSREPFNVSRHPDYDRGARWSSDGKILAFASRRQSVSLDAYSTQRYGGSYDIYFVFLEKALEQASELERREYFEQAAQSHADRLKKLNSKLRGASAEKDAKPFEVKIDFDGLPERIHRVTDMPEDVESFEMSADGAWYMFQHVDTLAAIRWDGSEFKKLPQAGQGATLARTRLGKRTFYLAPDGAPASLAFDGTDPKAHAMAARMAVDLAAERAWKYDEAARTLALFFYREDMKGVNWKAATDRWRPLALAATSSVELNAVFEWLAGELNASHMGLGGGEGSEPKADTMGRLGVSLDPAHSGPGVKIASIVPEGPLDREASKAAAGEVILAVGGQRLGETGNLHALLEGKAGRRVTLTLGAADGSGTERRLVAEPITRTALQQLQYKQMVSERRRLVEEWSGGRLGYAHVPVMFLPQVEELERDLTAACAGKEGLVLDVRHNRGGWTTDILLTMFFASEHATTFYPGTKETGYPQDRRPFYAWTKPAVLLCNERSFSNAEIFSHAWKTLGRGKLIGQPTFGGVISTHAIAMADGASLRIPGRGWLLPDGRDMENNGAEPDILVEFTPNDILAGDDPQLRRGVEEALKELPAPPPVGPLSLSPRTSANGTEKPA